ncbi:MAG: DUF2490 domain-containing protein [Gammaproteobacteria bacterium]|nr:DUF2490 domain-containing protein [Gammaproteobacteria bacterium]
MAASCALSVCGSLSAPALAADDNNGLWTIFSTTDAFLSDDGANRWHYWFDAQACYFDLGSGINQYLVRPGIGYRPGTTYRPGPAGASPGARFSRPAT